MNVVIPGRFNGPPNSGNGGYSCGLIANHIKGSATVRLHVPPPLDTPLSVKVDEEGAVSAFQGETLVGSGAPADFSMDYPSAPSLEAATAARARSPLLTEHPLDTCFVCGTNRQPDDGLNIHCGPVKDWELLACDWLPSEDLLDESGNVPTEIVWSALDCPGYQGCFGDSGEAALLGELSCRQLAEIPGKEPLVVYCWPVDRQGRKGWGGAAIANQAGTVLAYSLSLWITLKK